MILGDTKTVQAFYNQIPGSYLIGSGYFSCTAGYFIRSQKDQLTFPLLVPCSFDSEISLQLGGTNFVIQNSTFNFGTYSSDPNACVGAFVANDALGKCSA
jgi:hypothetical protein